MDSQKASDTGFGRSMRANVQLALLTLCAVGVLALLAGMEAFRVTEETRDYQAALEQGIAERAQTRRVYLTLQEAETSQRGYLLTQEEEYLDRFDEAREEIPDLLDRLMELFRGDAAQASRARRMKELAARRMRQLGDVLAATQLAEQEPDAQSGAIISRSRAGAGLETRTQIQALVDEMIALEEQDIRQASQALAKRVRFSRTLMIVLVGGIVLLVAFVVVLALAYLSRRSRVETELREATRLAREASEAKTQFLASMSHEIRTPLTGILGYTELLLEEKKLSARQRDYVARLQNAATSLSALVDDILDLSKIEAGEIAIVEASFPLSTLIANCLSITSVTAKKKGLELHREIDPALPEAVLGDEPRLRQVLLNLLNNALKFTGQGSVTLRVQHQGSTESGERIRFEVSDTGIGIAPEKQDRLFRRFSQASPSIQHEYGGTGLGLAISKRLVELMGGEIGVESKEGQGSTFWFTVTLPKSEAPDYLVLEAGESAAAGGGRILLAEDVPQNQDLVCTILRHQGHQVDVANDGEEALAMIRSRSYDLVLMDMQMPRMDGIEATRRIREMHGTESAIPIIAMTANVLPEQVQAFRQAGADDYIAKPFRKPALVARVAQWLAAKTDRGDGASEEATTDPTTPAVHDRAELEELRSLMGDEWTGKSLLRLRERIDQIFLEAAKKEERERDDLRRWAHRIVSDAGQLGFAELSQRASELEDACLDEDAIEPAFERARLAAGHARATIDRLLAEIDVSSEVQSG